MANLPYNSRYPIFLPTKSPLTKLIIWEAHNEVFHQRVRATLTQLQKECWICGSRYVPSASPDLPTFRVQIAPPFTNTGTDHTGPLYVRDIYNSKGKLYKCYIPLFSCCVTRMVHLEIQPNLEAAATIRGMQPTFARVKTPSLIISDNHKTYRSKPVLTFARNKAIEWKHILERAPHWGGFYERMKPIIKGALRKFLRDDRLTYEELETILIKIEAVINSRPLTNIHDLVEPLTSSHLMYEKCVTPIKRVTYIGLRKGSLLNILQD